MITASRKTKIVCTLGPSSSTPDMVEKLLKAGMNVVRLNFSHGSHEDHQKNIDMIRAIAKKHQYPIPIMMDLQGPKIRVGTMKDGKQELTRGDIIEITSEDV
ncbi:MAG: pyruvate kinase, partial [Balneolaceae bacterium]